MQLSLPALAACLLAIAIPGSFDHGDAREVRSASHAFFDMRQRIKRPETVDHARAASTRAARQSPSAQRTKI